ncbi:MAG: PIN domain-containing protein [Chthonomonadales bacterium]
MSIRNFKQLFMAVCALVLGGLGVSLGLGIKALPENSIFSMFREFAQLSEPYARFLIGALGMLGILLGVILGPKLAQRIIYAGNAIERMSTRDKISVGIGTFLGITVTLPFFLLLLQIKYVGIPISILLGFSFVYLGIRATMSMKHEFRFVGSSNSPVGLDGEELALEHCKILDTNVIIDGRIADVCRTGFVEGPLYVPGFVLDELQHIADSGDSLKRARGRRGLDILNVMQKEFPLIVRTYDNKLGSEAKHDEVDSKLVTLAKNMNAVIMTNDFNLNKVAALQGVTVLNVNELANALKPVVLPGEEMPVMVIKEGKEQNQGVAYLDDGTMIVIEDGRKHIGEHLYVIVTSVLQTVAGKMIFARVRGSSSNGDGEDGHYGDSGGGNSGGRSRPKIR